MSQEGSNHTIARSRLSSSYDYKSATQRVSVFCLDWKTDTLVGR